MMISLMVLTIGCDTEADPFRPKVTDVPGVQDLGVLSVITETEWMASVNLADPVLDGFVYYGRIGALENPQAAGGATFQFEGTGGEVCVVLDPEAVFWNYSVSQTQTGKYKYRDNYQDDGDVDLKVGLSSYYTGSPGVEIGSFEALYTDPSGVEHSLQFDECAQGGFQGTVDVHAGRATVESCTIDTATRAGVMYTVLVETFSLPTDDSIVSFGVAVIDGPCGDGGTFEYSVDECLFPDEVTNAEPERVTPDGKEWFADIEALFCDRPGQVNSYCEAWIASDEYVEDEGPCDDPEVENPGIEDTGAR